MDPEEHADQGKGGHYQLMDGNNGYPPGHATMEPSQNSLVAGEEPFKRKALNADEENRQEMMVEMTKDGEEVHSPSMVPYEGKAGVGSTVVNMMCNVIGGGVLVLPSAFHDSSLIVGLVLLAWTSIVTTTNLYFIVECAHYTKIYAYRLLLARGLGHFWGRVVDFSLFIFPFAALIVYCRVIADAMPPVMINYLGASGFVTTEGCWFLLGGLVFFGLSCRRALAELLVSSLFGLLTIFYAIILVVIRFFVPRDENERLAASIADDFDAVYVNLNMFKTIPVIAFALSVHNNAPAYYEELKDRSPERMYKVIKIAHVVIISSYAIMAFFGLISFGNSIKRAKGNILDAYAVDDALINSARLAMFVHFAAVYPILQMAARRGLNNFAFKTNDLKFIVLCAESFFIVVASVLLAYAIPDVETILSFIGSIFGSIIIMIAPSFLYLSVKPHGYEAKGRILWAYVSIIFGFTCMVLGVWATIKDAVSKGKESPAAPPNATLIPLI